MSWIVSLFLQALSAFGLGWLRDRRADVNSKELGAATASNETTRIIAEIADARSKVDVPGDTADLVRRLRRDAAAAGGSTVGSDQH